MTADAPFAPPRSRTPLRIDLEKVERVNSGCLWALVVGGSALIAIVAARWAGLDGPGAMAALVVSASFAGAALLSPIAMWRAARIRIADVRGPVEAFSAASGEEAWWPTWLHPARTPHVSGHFTSPPVAAEGGGVRWVVRFPSGRNTLAKPIVRDRVAVFVEHVTPMLLTVIPRDVVGAMDRWGSRTVATGDPALDERYLVAAEDVEALRALLAAPEVRPALDALLAVHPRFRLQTSAIGVWWWCPDAVEPATILAARDALLALARALDGAREAVRARSG